MACDIFDEFATDETLENKGVWRDMPKGGKLLIARSGNDAYGKLLSDLMEKHRVVLDGKDDAADAKAKEIMREVIASTVLLDWTGISYKGQEIFYTRAAAVEMLKHKGFMKRVMDFANDEAAYKAKLEQAQGEA